MPSPRFSVSQLLAGVACLSAYLALRQWSVRLSYDPLWMVRSGNLLIALIGAFSIALMGACLGFLASRRRWIAVAAVGVAGAWWLLLCERMFVIHEVV